ncbi:MAG: hypothetical protein ABSC18_08555 [Verrucomicrobiota bacterium]|jgi:hypothetical protein
MKMIFLLACVATLLTCTGCFFPGRGRGWDDRRGEVIVAPPVVAVATPDFGGVPLAGFDW